ncbi:MAG TPA: recombinase family protein [Acidisoma sp.]|jgi:DNA invertase Pin-like site-specific DNA recombinase|uniref:recombinase family protein n=1 Tax=Acidisoma sp. TaxID=1872115 RepID=UPI002BBBE267|nr:recombinase family protein [Acidisoma sp.]HTI03195.1 recombinase family protein [Acidisoma sp.]
MLIGYARTSTADQTAGLEAQERDLRAVGCEKIFSEQVSATAAVRHQLAAALAYVREGDVLVVTRPDRLARSTADLLAIEADLTKRGVGLLILSLGGSPLDTRSATARMTLVILAAVAEFERALMRERQIEGIAKAKSAGRYRGRQPTARKQADQISALRAEGLSASAIAVRLGVSRASVYRCLNTTGPA